MDSGEVSALKKITFLGLGLFLLGSTLWAEAPKTQTTAKVESVQSVIDHVKLQNPNLPIRLFAQGKKATVNVVTPTGPLKAHYHQTHEEVVYIIKGRGKMRLGDKDQDVKEGDIIYIPVKTVHSFVPEGGDCRVLSIFAPAFDGKDRIFVEENKR